LRHFADLRDGSHGGATPRRDKEQLFDEAVALLDPYGRQALDEINTDLLLDAGEITATGVRRSATDRRRLPNHSRASEQTAAINPDSVARADHHHLPSSALAVPPVWSSASSSATS
jgi:hypothetical protein